MGHRVRHRRCLDLRADPQHRVQLATRRVDHDDVAQPVQLGEEPGPGRIAENYAAIDRCFAADRLEDILAALAADGSDWAAKELATLAKKSPTACKVSLRLLVESPKQFHFLDEMRMEYAVVVRMFRHNDFIEGVRALLIDKDNAPQWNPSTPEGVTEEMIDAIFEPLPPEEEWTPLGAEA